jgi:hypothetical protein
VGLPFALGLVVSIYIHEMGRGCASEIRHSRDGADVHPRRRARPVEAGASERLRRRARRLAGPWWGLGAPLRPCGVAARWWGARMAIAKVGAWINLLNLIPIGPSMVGAASRR